MTTLDIAIVVVGVLVVLTFVWSTHCARNEPPRQGRRNDLERRREERDLL
jgi:hypothetical protein